MISAAQELIQEFAQYADSHDNENYVSVYLDIDQSNPANQSEQPEWRIYLKNALSDIENTLDPVQLRQWKKVRLSDTSPETAWARTRKRIDKYLTSYRPTEGKTLGLFISPSVEYAFELPVRLDNAAYYGKPHIQDFLWALDEYEQHLVVLVAQDQARALILALGDTTAEVTVSADDGWLRNVRKSAHEANISARQEDLDRRFVNTVIDRLTKYFLQNPDIQRIVLGGNMEMAHAVLAGLHPAAREKVIGVLAIPINEAPHEIADRIRPTAIAAEREYELSLVNDIIGQARAGGRGSIGYTAVSRAAERSAVQLLAIAYPYTAEDIEPILLDAVQAGATIEFVKGEALAPLEAAGGIAARNYYALT